MLIRAINWQLWYLYQLCHFQNRNLGYTFQTLFEGKRRFAHNYFLYENETRGKKHREFVVKPNCSIAMFNYDRLFITLSWKTLNSELHITIRGRTKTILQLKVKFSNWFLWYNWQVGIMNLDMKKTTS